MGYYNFYQLGNGEKKQIFEFIEYQHGLPAFAVEKDWWVVVTLDLLFKTSIKDHLVFKGGTSLSKAWQLLDRFSEDIDLGVDRSFFGYEGEISNRAINRLRADARAYFQKNLIPELQELFINRGFDVSLELESNGNENQDPAIVLVEYPVVTDNDSYVDPRVKIEIGSRSLREPSELRSIRSLVSAYFQSEEFADNPIKIPCVTAERTFIEKLFIMHEVTKLESKNKNPGRLSRHMYDLYQLNRTKIGEQAFQDPQLIDALIAHRRKFYRIKELDYDQHYPPSFDPIPPTEFLDNWKKDYRAMQENMIYGEKEISFDELLTTLNHLRDTYNNLSLTRSC